MGTVTTSSSATATAFGNQRKIDRCQNGVLWEIHNVSGAPLSAYSTDNGATWTVANYVGSGTGSSYTPNGSLFIDLDDYAHVVYKDPNDGYIKYVRGMPNAARTAYTWSAATTIAASTSWDYPDIVAHRDPANAGAWVAHIVTCRSASDSVKVAYARLTISSAGAITVATALVAISDNLTAANGNFAFPSIDFNHTGDGKTVAGGTPHLYVGWSAGATGAGYGIRFRKATYSAGSWTWGTEREIDSAHYAQGNDRWLSCFFDGTRFVLVGGQVTTGSNFDVVIHDRDAADPSSGGTTTRTVLSNVSGTNALWAGSATYDSAGNVYLLGRDESGSSGTRKVNSRRWVRGTQALDAVSTFDSTGAEAPYVSARRGPQGQAIDYVYTDGTASPYTVTSGRITLNQNPTAPTPLTPADNATWDSSTDQTVTLRPNDPDGDAASKVRIRYRPAGTSVPYAYLESTTAVPAGGTATLTVPANTWDGVIEYASQSYDPSGAEGAWSPTRVVTGVPAALAALTGGQGGTSADVLKLYDLVQSERALRALSLV